MSDSKHECEGELPGACYGEAIQHCYENEAGELWVSNDEYSSQVNFCPYCGFKARIQLHRVPNEIVSWNKVQTYRWEKQS